MEIEPWHVNSIDLRRGTLGSHSSIGSKCIVIDALLLLWGGAAWEGSDSDGKARPATGRGRQKIRLSNSVSTLTGDLWGDPMVATPMA
jgi:hypothetical protein